VSNSALLEFLEAETKNLRHAGLVRRELELTTPQGPQVKVADRELVNFASSDYLGLAGHTEIKKAAVAAIQEWGVGLASPRMASGTLALHAELERSLAKMLGTAQALVYASGHHANTGLFESLLSDRDYVFCDEMIRPSLADGIRLCRARVYAYRNNDMEHLEDRLRRSRAARFRMIATDGVFPLTGRIAKLSDIYALAAKYKAAVVVDDSQGLGVLGDQGEGTHAALSLETKVDMVTGSFGNALGGGAGGFIAGGTTVLAWLRQKSRSHLSATALAPAAVATARKALELLPIEIPARNKLGENLRALREAFEKHAGLTVETPHPAVSVRIGNAIAAQRLTDHLFRQGIFAIGYCHPVVPEGEARISLRVTARHTARDVEGAAAAIGEGMKALKISVGN
jgi:glycine C-acetyltransferase